MFLPRRLVWRHIGVSEMLTVPMVAETLSSGVPAQGQLVFSTWPSWLPSSFGRQLGLGRSISFSPGHCLPGNHVSLSLGDVSFS